MTLAKYVGTAHNSIGFYCAEVWNILRIQYIQVVYFQKGAQIDCCSCVCVFKCKGISLKICFF